MNRKIEVELLLKAAGFKGGMKDALDQVRQLEGESKRADTAVDKMAGALGKVKVAAAGLGLGLVAKGMWDIGKGAVDAAEKMNQLRGQIGALIAANHEVRDSSGALVQGVEKVRAVGGEVSAVFEKLQQDAMRTSDTTEGLIEKFTLALGPGLNAKMNLDQIRELTVATSVAMSALNIDSQQAKSEIKALFSGDIDQNADLARSLQLKREDIQLAVQQGKLYDLLKDKLKDYVAAGELQSRTLTGVTSSLDDIRGRLQQIMGDDATGSLTEGFGRMLDSIQDADGNLTEFGDQLFTVARTGGVALDGLAMAFVSLSEIALQAVGPVGEVLKGLLLNISTVAAGLGELAGKREMEQEAIGFQNQLMAAAAWDRNYKNWQTKQPRSNGRPVSQEDFARIAGSRPIEPGKDQTYQQRVSQIYESIGNADQAAEDALGDLINSLNGNKPSSRIGKPNLTPNGGGTGGAGDKAENARIRGLLREMGQDLEVNDASGGGFTGRIAILKRYIDLLGKGKLAADDVDKLLHDIDMAQIDRAKKVAKEQEEVAKTQRKVTEAKEEGARKVADLSLEQEVEEHRAASQAIAALIETRYRRGQLSANEYYGQLRKLREDEIRKEAEAEETKLRNQRDVLQRRYKEATGKSAFDPVEASKLKGEIDLIDQKLAGIGPRIALSLRENEAEIAQVLEDTIASGATRGLEMALQYAFSGDLDGMQTAFRQNFIKALTDAFEQSGLAPEVGKSLGLGDAAGASGSIGVAGMLAFADAAWNRLTLGDRMHAGEEAVKEILADASGNGPDQISKKYQGIREQITKARTMSDKVFGFEFNVQQGWLTPEEKERLRKAEADDREKEAKRAADVEARLLGEREREEREAAKRITDAWKEAMEAQKKQHQAMVNSIIDDLRRMQTEQQKMLDKRRQDDDILAIYGINSETVNEYQDLKRRIAAAKATANQASSKTTEANALQTALLERFAAMGGRFPVNVRSTSGGEVKDPVTGKVITDGRDWEYGAQLNTFSDDMEQFARWSQMKGLELTDDNGQRLSVRDFEAAVRDWKAASDAAKDSSATGAASSKEAEALQARLETLHATIRAGAKSAGADLGMEVDRLLAADDPEAMRRVRMAEIDAGINRRKEAYRQAGFIDGPGADPEASGQITSKLEQLRDIMKAQLDEQQEKYTAQNPLPVAVVELPKVFALPSSYYFRDRQPGNSVSVGRIEVNASGMNEAQAQKAIVGAVYELTDGVNRENYIRGSQLTV